MGVEQEKVCEGGEFRNVRNPPSQTHYTLASVQLMALVLLGHSDISTTLNLYVHPSYDKKKACVNSISFIL